MADAITVALNKINREFKHHRDACEGFPSCDFQDCLSSLFNKFNFKVFLFVSCLGDNVTQVLQDC